MVGAVILLLLAQYPPELPPIRPAIPILFMIVPAPQLDLPSAPSGQPVKVMWVFPSNTATSQADADTKCAAVMPADNTILTNSRISTPMQLVKCLYYTAYSGNTMSIDLNWLQSDYNANGPIRQIRDAVHADVVRMASLDGAACGLGYMNAQQYGPAWAYSIVNWDCAISNESSAHEFGHNAGLCHDDPNATTCTPAQPDGYGLCDSPHSRRDPMVYPSPCGGSRVPYFSDSTDIHFGYPFGDATHQTARVLRITMPILANFYPPLLPLPAAPGRPIVSED